MHYEYVSALCRRKDTKQLGIDSEIISLRVDLRIRASKGFDSVAAVGSMRDSRLPYPHKEVLVRRAIRENGSTHAKQQKNDDELKVLHFAERLR